MDKERALNFAENILGEMKSKSYTELVELIDMCESKIHKLDSSDYYQTQIQVYWDDSKEKKDIRVSCNIDGCGISAFAPLSTDFIITPRGTFIE